MDIFSKIIANFLFVIVVIVVVYIILIMPLCYAMPTKQCILNEIKVLGADDLRPSLNILLNVIVVIKLHINELNQCGFLLQLQILLCGKMCV